jgi:hypothetical protein
MDWYAQFSVCSLLWIFPFSIARSSRVASRRTKPPPSLSLSDEAAHAFVLSSDAHLENSETLTSCGLMRAGVSIIVARQVTGLPTPIV